MSSLDLVRAYYTAIDAGDLDAAFAGWAAHATYRRPGYPPLVGIEAIRDFYESTRVIAGGSHTLEECVADDDSVAVRGSFSGSGHDGAALFVRFADFWHFAAGRVDERNTYFDAAAV